ncbi:MAG: hypothetical protein QX194_02015 [Methylococcales bacterium]
MLRITHLKAIYHSITVDEAEKELDAFASKWDGKYPRISRSVYDLV